MCVATHLGRIPFLLPEFPFGRCHNERQNNRYTMASAARAETPSYAGDVSPADAWSALNSSPSAQLVDVRTQAEWSFSGFFS